MATAKQLSILQGAARLVKGQVPTAKQSEALEDREMVKSLAESGQLSPEQIAALQKQGVLKPATPAKDTTPLATQAERDVRIRERFPKDPENWVVAAHALEMGLVDYHQRGLDGLLGITRIPRGEAAKLWKEGGLSQDLIDFFQKEGWQAPDQAPIKPADPPTDAPPPSAPPHNDGESVDLAAYIEATRHLPRLPAGKVYNMAGEEIPGSYDRKPGNANVLIYRGPDSNRRQQRHMQPAARSVQGRVDSSETARERFLQQQLEFTRQQLEQERRRSHEETLAFANNEGRMADVIENQLMPVTSVFGKIEAYLNGEPQVAELPEPPGTQTIITLDEARATRRSVSARIDDLLDHLDPSGR